MDKGYREDKGCGAYPDNVGVLKLSQESNFEGHSPQSRVINPTSRYDLVFLHEFHDDLEREERYSTGRFRKY